MTGLSAALTQVSNEGFCANLPKRAPLDNR